jgi:hypothetical protein
VRTKFKQISLGVCLFVFLFVVIGGGLHLSSSGAFLAAATGTPLLIHVLNRLKTGGSGEPSLQSASRSPASVHRVAGVQADHPGAFESEDVMGR